MVRSICCPWLYVPWGSTGHTNATVLGLFPLGHRSFGKYISVSTPPTVILLYADGTKRFKILITAAFTFSFDSYSLLLKLYCTSASTWPVVLRAGSTTRCGPGSGHATHAVGHRRSQIVGSNTMPPYSLFVDWYDGTVLIFSMRSRLSLFKCVPFGPGCNDGRTPNIVIAFSAVIFETLISMCLVLTLFVVDLLSPIDHHRCRQVS